MIVGWPLDRFAEAAGLDRAAALTILRAAVADGTVMRVETGGRVLFARVDGGAITDITPAAALAAAATPKPTPKPGRRPADRKPRKRNR